MTDTPRLATLALCLAAIAWFGWDTHSAYRLARKVRSDLDSAVALARELLARREFIEPDGAPKPDPAALIPMLHEALLASSLPTQTLASFASEGSEAPTSARATLEPITLPQLGSLLAHWRESNPGWTVTTIELVATNSRSSGRTLAPGTAPIDIPSALRVGLVLEPTMPSPAGFALATDAVREELRDDGESLGGRE